MWNKTPKTLILALAIGLLGIGLNLFSERWANSKIGPLKHDAGEICSEENLEFKDKYGGSISACFDAINEQNLNEAFEKFHENNFFPSLALIAFILLSGSALALSKMKNSWYLVIVLGVILGLVKGVLSGSLLVIASYVVFVGIGFVIGKLLLRFMIPHNKRMQSDLPTAGR